MLKVRFKVKMSKSLPTSVSEVESKINFRTQWGGGC